MVKSISPSYWRPAIPNLKASGQPDSTPLLQHSKCQAFAACIFSSRAQSGSQLGEHDRA
jgi:hypothetical protein